MAVLIGVALAYAGLAAAAFFGQRRLMYPAPADGAEPSASGARLERFRSADGAAVCALYLPAHANRPTIVHFHGNGEDLSWQGALFERLGSSGFGVYAPEYPGYGLLRERAVSEQAIYDAAEAALRHLHDALGVPASRTVLQGQSLGTGVAVEMARRGHGARLILISPFTSMTDMARRVLPFVPVQWLVRDRYETADKAPNLALPALVIHGTGDEIIPVKMGRKVAELLPHSKLVLIERGHHNDLFVVAPELVQSEIAAFAGDAK
jgi:pimeloyl-ACP methyl ester carboxylesterase